MNTGSKAQVFVRATIGDERVWIRNCARVAIGYRSSANLMPGFHWYAPDRNLLFDQAPYCGRNIIAQKFVDRGSDNCAIVHKAKAQWEVPRPSIYPVPLSGDSRDSKSSSARL